MERNYYEVISGMLTQLALIEHSLEKKVARAFIDLWVKVNK